jgi:hypothetical protein
VQDPPRKRRRGEMEESSPDVTNSNPWYSTSVLVIHARLIFMQGQF